MVSSTNLDSDTAAPCCVDCYSTVSCCNWLSYSGSVRCDGSRCEELSRSLNKPAETEKYRELRTGTKRITFNCSRKAHNN